MLLFLGDALMRFMVAGQSSPRRTQTANSHRQAPAQDGGMESH
jgi:hypothetical protein